MKTIEYPEWLYRVADRVHWPLGPRQTLMTGLIALAAGLALYANCGLAGCPDVDQLAAYQPGGAPVLLDRHGEEYADLAPYERVIVSLDSLPPFVPNAFIAVEDRRFWEHRGVDWVRVVGAALANVASMSASQGSSTIPMQLARNVFPKELPGTERTMKRKLQEARVARQIEARFGKADILEMYLNHIYFGGGAYGIEAASRLYFDKTASELTLAEAATLAALPKAPAHYDPRRRPERSRERRDVVLSLMAAQEMVDSAQVAEAREVEVVASSSGTRSRSSIPDGAFFIDVVRDQLEDRFGEELYRSRLRIHTTVDPVAQRAAERELTAQVEDLDGRVRAGEGELQGAMVVLEARTGDVLALVGGRDAATSRYNRAVLASRQIGSAFKPFVYAAALQEGIPTSHLVLDAPLRMQLSRNDVWEPENYDGQYHGDISLRQALVGSRNIPTVRLATEVGIADVAMTAREAGVTAEMDLTPALALGTVSMSPLQLATAYTTFATLGTTASPRFVIRVEDEDGTVLWQTEPVTSRSALDPGVAYIVTDILRDAVDYGTGTGVRAAGFRGAAAGKTGTTNNATNAWFVGYTPDVVGAVWIGYDTPSSMGSAATGGGFAAPVFGRVMRQLYTSRKTPPEWQVPDGVLRFDIDPYTGLVLQAGCLPRSSRAESELFIEEHLPPAACPYRDYWGGFWDRLGDVFRREGTIEDERGRGRDEVRGRGRGQDRGRDREMEEFLRERSERLRRENGGLPD
ncbi:MAG: PBP1A family penicillin-binding protein [Gemmatimonadota bacterium]